eukprot:15441117-Alexandrium_andersonii.AAC.1
MLTYLIGSVRLHCEPSGAWTRLTHTRMLLEAAHFGFRQRSVCAAMADSPRRPAQIAGPF